MADPHGKFDAALEDILEEYVAMQRGEPAFDLPARDIAERGEISLRLHFLGDLAPIEARGFRTEWQEGNLARGDVALADLAAISELPEVLELARGRGRPKILLNTSVKEIKVRGTGNLWTVTTSGTFGGKTGTGTYVGVIDTGIDFRHPVFMKHKSPNTTRIKRIWDLGIAPHGSAKSPDKSLLMSNFTYGVEYTDTMINDVLQKKAGATPVKHRDCNGHGTHVAAIAAGDGRKKKSAPKAKTYDLVGVAPGAELIIVKLLYLETDPVHGGSRIDEERLFEDAVTYVERVAATAALGNKPVAINASIGWVDGPHDGLLTRDLFIENRFAAATKKVFVAAAGNEGLATDTRNHAKITIPGTAPANGTINIPFTLFDGRQGWVKDRNKCSLESNTEDDFEVEFWYKTIAPKTLSVSLKPPRSTTATAGPALNGAMVKGTYKIGTRQFSYELSHQEKVRTPPGSTTPVKRNVVRIKFLKHKADVFGWGAFTLAMTAPAGTEVFGWAQATWPDHGIKLGPNKTKPASRPDVVGPLPTGMTVPSEGTVISPASSKGAIAVANYDDVKGKLNPSSSRGPLVDYFGQGVHVAKPDIAAPGTQIEAANSGGSVLGRLLTRNGKPYMPLDGTSMASPHVAGIVALLFEKKPNLSMANVLQALKSKARAPKNKPNEFGAGKVHAKDSHGAV